MGRLRIHQHDHTIWTEWDDFTRGWVVGLLEGEGTFGYYKSGVADYRYPTVQIRMTDRDAIQRIADLWHRACTYEHPPCKVALGSQPTYKSKLAGEPALRLMRGAFPYLSERRKLQVRAVFERAGEVLD